MVRAVLNAALSRVTLEVVVAVVDQVVERLAADEDDLLGLDRGGAHEPLPGANSPEPRAISVVGCTTRRDGPA